MTSSGFAMPGGNATGDGDDGDGDVLDVAPDGHVIMGAFCALRAIAGF